MKLVMTDLHYSDICFRCRSHSPQVFSESTEKCAELSLSLLYLYRIGYVFFILKNSASYFIVFYMRVSLSHRKFFLFIYFLLTFLSV